jgi:hypothetical protein
MRRRWFEILLGLVAVNPSSPSSAAATNSLSSPPHSPSKFYINQPSNQDANTVQRSQIIPRAPFSENKLIFDASDSRRALDDWELEDFVLVATIEGSLYALDRYSGAQKWVLEGNGPAVRSKGSKNDNDVEDADESNSRQGTDSIEKQPRWIVQPVEGGQLFLFDPEFGVLVY